jgi:hypothetical protein
MDKVDPFVRLVTIGGTLWLLVAVYAVSCWVWPFARCWICEGTGKRARADGRVWRPCRWCRGTGRRLRIGRRLHNAATRVRRRAR